MSYYIILHGPLGSGKSTNAKLLAETLQGKRVMLDNVLADNHLDDAKENQGCISASNFKQGLDIVIPHIRQWMQEGTVVIIDGCFYHEEVLEYLRRQLCAPGTVCTLQAPLELCIKRDQERVHTLGEQAARAVHQLVSHLEFGTVIDASGTVEETQEQILSSITPMTKVYVLQHVNTNVDPEDVKLIGVYSSRMLAIEAVERLKTQPGFRDLPRIVNNETDDDEGGFHIDRYWLDTDHWAEGYVTIR